jgi:plastocyanin
MRLMACLLAIAALAVAGCGGSSKSSGSSGSTPTPSATSGGSSGGGGGGSSSGGGSSVPVAADPNGAIKFTTTTLKAKSGTVTFNFTNKASIPHAFAIQGNGVNAKGKTVSGGSDTLTVKLKPGTYTFYCPVPGHEAAGMKGTLTVS